jgi:hypothetical protein
MRWEGTNPKQQASRSSIAIFTLSGELRYTQEHNVLFYALRHLSSSTTAFFFPDVASMHDNRMNERGSQNGQ